MTRKKPPQSLLDHFIVIGALSRRFDVPHALWGVVIFAVYYLVPLVLCAFEGVLISATAAQQKLLPPQIIWLAKHVGDRPSVTLPYLRDSTHLLMAVVISIGGAVAITALDSFDNVYRSVANPELLNVTEEEVHAESRRAERQLSSVWVIVLFVLIAAFCGAALYLDGKVNIGWWGNPAYGDAGLVLALTIPLAMFYGMHALYLLAVGQHSISKLISKGIKLRPFHPDGSNGFASLGNFLLLLLALCILCALAAWVTLWHGYLGIEDFPGIWLGAIGVVVFIPWIVIQPLIHVTREIRRAQMTHLAPVERLLNTVLNKTEAQLGEPDFRVANIEDLKTLRDLHVVASDVYETSVFPFNRKVAGVLSIGYVLQVITLVKEVAGKFK
ncbi:MAG: hypothetical protein WAN69_05310 [Candidatus Korobacteraceae bacterium]